MFPNRLSVAEDRGHSPKTEPGHLPAETRRAIWVELPVADLFSATRADVQQLVTALEGDALPDDGVPGSGAWGLSGVTLKLMVASERTTTDPRAPTV
jgi:hypothetical protein